MISTENPREIKGNFSEDEAVIAKAIFEWGVGNWLRGQVGEKQTIRNLDRSVPPFYRIDSHINGEPKIVVLFEREDGPIEDSKFSLKYAFRACDSQEIFSAIREKGYITRPEAILQSVAA